MRAYQSPNRGGIIIRPLLGVLEGPSEEEDHSVFSTCEIKENHWKFSTGLGGGSKPGAAERKLWLLLSHPGLPSGRAGQCDHPVTSLSPQLCRDSQERRRAELNTQLPCEPLPLMGSAHSSHCCARCSFCLGKNNFSFT